ncbi:MAG: tetratricopeptide repeat protein [Panacagrimonas sp.]
MKLSTSFVRGFFCLLAATPAGLSLAAPYRPADDAQILERLPAAAPARPLVADRLALAPELAARLAQTYIQRSRQTGDPRELGYAQGVLQPWWNTADAPDPVLLLRATLRQSRHDFDGALADLDRLLARRPADAQAWLTRATILRVQGRYPEAARACTQLQPLADPFVQALCRESVRGLNGELREATQALDALRPALASQPAAIAGWYFAERADMAVRAGRVAEAETLYRTALAAQDDIDLRASLADLLLDRGAAAEVLPLIALDTPVDALRLRLALALHQMGDARLAPLDALIRDGFDAARQRGDGLHLREEARYRLAFNDDPQQVLAIAQANWAIQHEPQDARVLLLAARAAGRADGAAPVLAWREISRLEDVRLDRIAAPPPTP